MNRLTLSAACLTMLIGVQGCAYNNTADAPVAAENNTQLCPGGACETDPFINYTQTRAPYRQYGELSPRDRLVSQSGAGNNISASLPPSIEDEVISYETQVETQAAQAAPVEETAAAVPAATEAAQAPAEASSENVADALPSPKASSETTDASDVAENTVQETAASPVPAEEQIVTVEEVSPENVTETAGLEQDDYVDEEGEDAVRDWYADEGQNLKALLTEWSEQSGWRLVWNTNRNYVLNAGAMFRGRFADVSSALIRAFARARPAPIATFYKGNRVLVVETMEDENAFD